MSYIDIYLACEEAGAGWSTATGSIMRYWLRDIAGTEAMMDFSIHDAGSFDSITDMWVHAVLVVDPASLVTYDDGAPVPDAEYGFYGAPTQNSASPAPSNLVPPLAASNTFDLRTDIFLGGRVDRDGDRHFHGKLALFQIYEGPLTDVQVRCVFMDGDAALPEPQASHCTDLELDARLVGDLTDRSGNDRVLTSHGTASFESDGAHFNGPGDYISVAAAGFDYASDAAFTVAFWMTKEQCGAGIYEYLYSHNSNAQADIVDDLSNSNINIYLGCEAAGGGWSTSGGTVVRFNMIDGARNWASFDYPLHEAGSFDAITNVWMQVVLISNYF